MSKRRRDEGWKWRRRKKKGERGTMEAELEEEKAREERTVGGEREEDADEEEEKKRRKRRRKKRRTNATGHVNEVRVSNVTSIETAAFSLSWLSANTFNCDVHSDWCILIIMLSAKPM